MKRLVKRARVAGALLAATAGTAGASTRIYLSFGPPPPPVVVRGYAPAPGYVWVDGYHRWAGHGYVWVPGYWAAPPHRHARYYAGGWHHNHRGYYYSRGYWR